MSTPREETVLPPKDAEALAAVEQLLASEGGQLRLLASDHREALLPEELRRVLGAVAVAMHRGQAVTVAPRAMRLTTQQAADVLGISRPTLVKLLDEGRIPYETPNRHRRIRLVDLLAFQQARRTERRDTLTEMAQEAQKSGLYDEPAENYGAALAEARRKLA